MPRRLPAALVLAIALLAAVRGDAGHELSFYPSFYPQEIALTVLDAPAAARQLASKTLHAYVGSDPFTATTAPAHISYARSFASWLVLTFERTDGPYTDAAARCTGAARVARALGGTRSDVVVHPYPVTPYHGDYVRYADLAGAARKRLDADGP